MNPPCYRCISTTPLGAGLLGLCRTCSMEVDADRNRVPLAAICSKCGHLFVSDWERIQHAVNQRHNYRAWTAADAERAAAEKARTAR